MNRSTRILLPIALSLIAGASFAQGPIQGNEVFAAGPSSLSRAEVAADARAARDASLIPHGEILPVQKSRSVGKTRAQVAAETAEAQRLGLLPYGEELKFPTPAQAERIRLAGVQANQVVQK